MPDTKISYQVTENNEIRIISCAFSLTEIEIPPVMGKLPVTEIGNHAFCLRDRLKKITLPDTIRRIGREAFGDCDALEYVDIKEGVEEIADSAFARCHSLKEINLPSTLVSIGSNAFQSCSNLMSVTVPEQVTELEDFVFTECVSLEKVEILSPLHSIGRLAFNNCKNLVNINLPDTIVSIGEKAFCDCVRLENVNIPKNLEEAGNWAFMNCRKIKLAVIPKSLENIGEMAFGYRQTQQNPAEFTTIPDFTIVGSPESVAKAYADENELMFVYLREEQQDKEEIKKFSNFFYKVSDNEAVIVDCNYNARSVNIPPAIDKYPVSVIADEAFAMHFLLTSVTIPDTVRSMGKDVFRFCEHLENVTLSRSLTAIDDVV